MSKVGFTFRSVGRSKNQSSTEDSSSEDEMDWSGNDLLLESLSIPQLDGTADENSGKIFKTFVISFFSMRE